MQLFKLNSRITFVYIERAWAKKSLITDELLLGHISVSANYPGLILAL